MPKNTQNKIDGSEHAEVVFGEGKTEMNIGSTLRSQTVWECKCKNHLEFGLETTYLCMFSAASYIGKIYLILLVCIASFKCFHGFLTVMLF